jgi:hypothetical protein
MAARPAAARIDSASPSEDENRAPVSVSDVPAAAVRGATAAVDQPAKGAGVGAAADVGGGVGPDKRPRVKKAAAGDGAVCASTRSMSVHCCVTTCDYFCSSLPLTTNLLNGTAVNGRAGGRSGTEAESQSEAEADRARRREARAAANLGELVVAQRKARARRIRFIP